MAHKKGVGSSRNGRDSNAQRLGIADKAGLGDFHKQQPMQFLRFPQSF